VLGLQALGDLGSVLGRLTSGAGTRTEDKEGLRLALGDTSVRDSGELVAALGDTSDARRSTR
jgi:hypothetical protein